MTLPITETISVRLAQNQDEVSRAQSLRYRVFYEEYSAKADATTQESKQDIDPFDDVTDHLIVLDHTKHDEEQIVGTYRLLRREIADQFGKFYTSDEYNIAPILSFGTNQLELGRSCVLAPYRTRPVLQLLWQGIASYVRIHQIDIMFGCASFHETDIEKIKRPLSYLYHYHLAPGNILPRALDARYIAMNYFTKDELNIRKELNSLPPLIKGYVRAGASVGDGAVYDQQFNTTDICIVLPTKQITQRYKHHFKLPSEEELIEQIRGDDKNRSHISETCAQS